MWALQFGPRAFVVAPWAALVPLLLLLARRHAARLGLLHGLIFWLAAIPWIAPTLEIYGQLPRLLAFVLLLLLATYLALYHWAFAALGSAVWRAHWGLALGCLPALWVSLEWLRTYLISGFPWNLAAYAWVEVPGALSLAAWLGPFGVSYLVIFANAGLALGLERRRLQPAATGVLVPLLLLALAGRWAGGRAEQVATPGQAVRVLQPNIANLVAWDPVEAQRNYERVMEMSRRACDQPGALLLWPESAAWPLRFDLDPVFHRAVRSLTEEEECSVLLSSPHLANGELFNSAYLVRPGGSVQRYDKRHLVPYGEYVPLKRWLPFVGKLARNAGDFSPARRFRILAWGPERLGTSICFEIVFPSEVALAVRRGASLLVAISNDAWYGDTAAPWQHFRAARFRAAENRRPLLRAAITGVSGIVAADGSVEAQLGVFEEGVLRSEVRGRVDLSPYTRYPWLVPAACLAWTLLCPARRWRSPKLEARPGSVKSKVRSRLPTLR